ncbi:MAG: hypothetical protein H6733_10200 [Alphaproteobacteria bacterium]|nr:hypothetical protein [Alphaproteobacteria bacterium]
MTTTGELQYLARLPLPDAIERGGTAVLSCPVYAANALVAPSTGTITLTAPSGTVLVDAATVTVTGSVATYTYTAPTTLTLGEGYVVDWALSVDGSTLNVRNAAEVVRRRLVCPISGVDLYRVASSLDPDGDDPVTRKTDFDAYIVEAWTSIQLRLREMGSRINLVIASSSLREVTLETTLALIWGDMSHRLNPAYADLARDHRERAEAAWGRLRLDYDDTDDGVADGRKQARPAVFWLGRGR